MIEVMVAIVVLSLGMLGIAQVLLQALKTGQGSYQRVQASILATDMVERMRANRTQAEAGAYDGTCSGTVTQPDLGQWCTMLASLLPPGADGMVDVRSQTTSPPSPCPTGDALEGQLSPPLDVYVRIRWYDRSVGGEGANQCFEYRTRL